MDRLTLQSPLRVCLVGQNCLAAAYIGKLLKGVRKLHPLSLKQYLYLSPVQRRNTVFVLDQCGLDVPLCECLRQLRQRCSNPKFIVLDHEKSNDDIVRLLVMGAHGYVRHTDVPLALVRAILCVAADNLWVPHEALQEFFREAASALRKDAHGRQTTTPREDEILELVRRRLSNREIAQLLKIQVSTVKFHLSNILSKMHASSRRDLVELPSGDAWRMLLS